MKDKMLYIFVEGNDDERFFSAIVVPRLKKEYLKVEVIKYAQWKKEKVSSFISSIRTLGFHYIFTADLDNFSTLGEKKRFLKERFSDLNTDLAEIVIKEIESWYYAGLDLDFAYQKQLKVLDSTDNLFKEEFNLLYHGKFKSRIDFMSELLKNFDHNSARQRNASYRYFAKKYLQK